MVTYMYRFEIEMRRLKEEHARTQQGIYIIIVPYFSIAINDITHLRCYKLDATLRLILFII